MSITFSLHKTEEKRNTKLKKIREKKENIFVVVVVVVVVIRRR
jgi:hypothetical protein